MSLLTESAIRDALREVQEPELGGDLISRGMVKSVEIEGDRVALNIELTTPACPLKDEIEGNINAVLAPLGADAVAVEWTSMVRRAAAAVGPAAGARRQEHHRRRIRQGRRRQDHGELPTWPSRWPWKAPRSACSMPTSPAPTCPS